MVTTCNLGAGQRSALRRRQSGLVQESIRNVRSALKVTGGAVMFANLKLTVGAMSDLVTRLADPAERARIEALGEEYLPCEPSIETVHHDTLDGVPSVELPLPTVVRNIEQARSEPLPHIMSVEAQ